MFRKCLNQATIPWILNLVSSSSLHFTESLLVSRLLYLYVNLLLQVCFVLIHLGEGRLVIAAGRLCTFECRANPALSIWVCFAGVSHGDGVQLLLFCPQLGHLSSDSFLVGCVGFVVSRCVPKEHPPTYLGRGHHGVWFASLAVILGQWPKKFQKKFYGFYSPLSGRRFRSFENRYLICALSTYFPLRLAGSNWILKSFLNLCPPKLYSSYSCYCCSCSIYLFHSVLHLVLDLTIFWNESLPAHEEL